MVTNSKWAAWIYQSGSESKESLQIMTQNDIKSTLLIKNCICSIWELGLGEFCFIRLYINSGYSTVSRVRNYCTVNYYNALALVYESVFPRDSPVITRSTLLILLPYIQWNYDQMPRASSLDLGVINQISIRDFKVLTQQELKNRPANFNKPVKWEEWDYTATGGANAIPHTDSFYYK